MNKSGKKKSGGLYKPVHTEHLDEIINQKSMPSFLASVSFHMILLIVILLIPTIPVLRDRTSPFSYTWDGEKKPAS